MLSDWSLRFSHLTGGKSSVDEGRNNDVLSGEDEVVEPDQGNGKNGDARSQVTCEK